MSLADTIRARRQKGDSGPFNMSPGGTAPGKENRDAPQDILKVRLGNNGDHIGQLVDPADAGFGDAIDQAVKAYQNGNATEEQLDFLETYADAVGIKG